ncbi:MAG: glycosyltransferase family 2 protein [Chthoniobacteraceae bacterium]
MIVLFVGMSLTTLWHLRWVHRLPALEALPPPPVEPPRCSVIIAARDEEAQIEGTIQSLLAQEGVEIELIVVDDRSSDHTAKIVRTLAIGDERVHLKRVDVLPEDWLGKCHACHLGALAATGDWILFTDADCWLKPDVIVRALRVAERDHADHVTMAAGTKIASVGARAWYLLFLTGLLGWFSGVNRDRPRAHVGIGAFNLVRAAAYRQCGGYKALRLTVVDDIKLGLLLRRSGKRTRAFLGGDDVECHWGMTVRSMIKIMEKNYFAALDYRIGVAVAGALFVTLLVVVLIVSLLSRTAIGLAAALSPLTLIVPAGILARRVVWTWPCAVCMPFMFLAFLYALLNSTFTTLSRGGIRWRETFYPLANLRAGNVQ